MARPGQLYQGFNFGVEWKGRAASLRIPKRVGGDPEKGPDGTHADVELEDGTKLPATMLQVNLSGSAL